MIQNLGKRKKNSIFALMKGDFSTFYFQALNN